MSREVYIRISETELEAMGLSALGSMVKAMRANGSREWGFVADVAKRKSDQIHHIQRKQKRRHRQLMDKVSAEQPETQQEIPTKQENTKGLERAYLDSLQNGDIVKTGKRTGTRKVKGMGLYAVEDTEKVIQGVTDSEGVFTRL